MNPTHDVAIFPWSGSKMSLQHSASGFHPAICPVDALFCSPLHPTALTCLLTVQTAEQERGNIQAHGPPICLPAAWQGREPWGGWPLIGCGSSTLIWLALTCREVGWRGGGDYGLKLGGDSWLWRHSCNGHREGQRQSISNKSIPVKWSKGEVLSTGALCLPCAAIFHLCTVLCVPIRPQSMYLHVHSVFFYQHE